MSSKIDDVMAALEADFVRMMRGNASFYAGDREDDIVKIDGDVDLRALAVAAVKAMREPTETMTIEGTNVRMSTGLSTYNETPAMWIAMIDAALKDD